MHNCISQVHSSCGRGHHKNATQSPAALLLVQIAKRLQGAEHEDTTHLVIVLVCLWKVCLEQMLLFDKGKQEGVAILGLCLRVLACSCITVMQLATCMSQYVSNSDIKLFVSQEVGFQCNITPDTHHV